MGAKRILGSSQTLSFLKVSLSALWRKRCESQICHFLKQHKQSEVYTNNDRTCAGAKHGRGIPERREDKRRLINTRKWSRRISSGTWSRSCAGASPPRTPTTTLTSRANALRKKENKTKRGSYCAWKLWQDCTLQWNHLREKKSFILLVPVFICCSLSSWRE